MRSDRHFGDTGKAALEGFRDVPGTSVMVFYPADGVSPAQKLQMVTQEGENCRVAAVEGSFDDTQTGVKSIFADPALAAELKSAGKISRRRTQSTGAGCCRRLSTIAQPMLTCCSVKKSSPRAGQFRCSTGNFGNILAAWYASRMACRFTA
jgi:threonine synthase